MSRYLATRSSLGPRGRNMRVRKVAGLGDWADDVISNCMKAAIGRTATFDAQTEDLARNWKPTGVYTPADVRTIVATTMKMVAPASSALIAAFENEPLETQVGNLRQAGDDLDRKGKQGLAYLDAAAEAEAKGTYVEADLKTWVLYTRNAASSAMEAAFVATCVTPSLLDSFAMVWLAWGSAVVEVCKTAAKVVLEVGKTAVKVVTQTVDVLAWVAKYGPWLAVAGAGVWLYRSMNKKR